MVRLLVTVCLAIALIVGIARGDAGEEASPKKFKTKEVAGTAARDKLLDDLFIGYKKYNYPENTTIQFGISVLNVDFDEEHDIMNTNVWFRYVWTDSRLVWDAEERGIKVMRVPADKLWLPDITLYNGLSQNLDCWQSNTIIYPDGKVLWVPPCNIKSYCNLTLERRPFEEQECMLKFGSWTFDGFTMGLDFYGDSPKADIDYFAGRKFKVTKNIAIKEEKKYDCCVEPYYNIRYTLGFTRQTEGATFCNKH